MIPPLVAYATRLEIAQHYRNAATEATLAARKMAALLGSTAPEVVVLVTLADKMTALAAAVGSPFPEVNPTCPISTN